MNLNLYSILDELSDYQSEIVVNAGIVPNLHGIRWLQEIPDENYSNNLYLIKPEDILLAIRYTGVLQTVCVGFDENEKQKAYKNWNCIFVNENVDIQVLFRELQDIFDKYHEWSERLTNAVLNGNCTKSILTIGSEYLLNPIALFDISFCYVASSLDIRTPLPSDSVWKSVIQYGRSPIDIHTKSDRQWFYQKLYTAETSFLMPALPPFRDRTWMISPILYQGNLCGFLAATDLICSFSHGQLVIIDFLQHLLGIHFGAFFNKDISATLDVPYFFDRMIKGYTVKEEILKHELGKLGWKPEDPFRVYYASGLIGTDSLKTKYAVSRFKEAFPKEIVFPYEDGIVIIIRESDASFSCVDDKNSGESLKRIFLDIDLVAGVSSVFFQFTLIKHALTQAKAALKQGKSCTTEQHVHFFEDVFDKLIISYLEDSVGIECFCYQPMLASAYSGQLTIDLLKTLRYYILNGGNLSKTAEMLCIHRNTLIYRLDRIESLLGANLKELDLQHNHLLLYLSCLALESKDVKD